jgi:hypothetical protein
LPLKKILQVLLAFALAASLHAQTPVGAPDYVTAYSPEQVDQLAAPIALYPDVLIAIILPAATAPSDITLAAQYLAANGDPSQIASQPWDDSVKALANYPEVIQWMNSNLDWTAALGRAFLQQPTQVMESIQQLRAIARANGTLVDTPQQKVVMDGSSILIVPATNDAIYVPEYDPDTVFADDEPVVYTEPVIFFGSPFLVGPWLSYECDWDDFGVWLGVYHPGWAYVRDWRQPRPGAGPGGFWRANNVHQGALLRTMNRPVGALPQARPMAKAPVVAQRSTAGFHPAATNPPSRPDPTGWRTDNSGKLAVPPRAAAQTGPKIITSPSVTPSPQTRAPDLNEIRPQESAPVRSAGPQIISNNPPPVESAPRVQAAPGPAFGSYTRGTTAQESSNRGQASRAAASPPPEPAPRSAPAEPRSEPAPQPRSEQAPASAPEANPRDRH